MTTLSDMDEVDYWRERVDELSVANATLHERIEELRGHVHRLEVALDNKNGEIGRLTMIANHLYND